MMPDFTLLKAHNWRRDIKLNIFSSQLTSFKDEKMKLELIEAREKSKKNEHFNIRLLSHLFQLFLLNLRNVEHLIFSRVRRLQQLSNLISRAFTQDSPPGEDSLKFLFMFNTFKVWVLFSSLLQPFGSYNYPPLICVYTISYIYKSLRYIPGRLPKTPDETYQYRKTTRSGRYKCDLTIVGDHFNLFFEAVFLLDL